MDWSSIPKFFQSPPLHIDGLFFGSIPNFSFKKKVYVFDILMNKSDTILND